MTHELLGTLDPFDINKALTLSQAAQRLRGRKRLGVARGQAGRWVREGVIYRGWAGPPLKLPAEFFAHSYLVMPQWVEAFEEARRKMSQRVTPPREASDKECQAAHRRAVAALAKRGIICGPAPTNTDKVQM